MKTAEEVEALKRNWLGDPVWNIEDTTGYEEYRDELIGFRHDDEARRAMQRSRRLNEKSFDLGVYGNLKLAAYVEGLERQISELQARLDRIEGKDGLA